MAVRSRFSTRTVVDSRYIVPWLAAEGPLAYSPADFFQYTWILPEIFDQNVNLREHRYFGSPLKDGAHFLFDFWNNVRSGGGAALQRYCELGFLTEREVRTPLAAYHYIRKRYNTPGFVLIQHGSYQWISSEDQPLIEAGEVVLYRGIGRASIFRQLRFRPDALSSANREVWRKYLALQAGMLSDSTLSFNTIHDRIKRCETGGLRDGTWVSPRSFGRARSSRIPSIRTLESESSVLTMSPSGPPSPTSVSSRFSRGSPRSRSSIRAASTHSCLLGVKCI